MNITDPQIEKYIEGHCTPEPDLLHRINRETHLEVLLPRMLSGQVQGRFLSMLSWMMRPKRILEIGTYTGYSALCLAEGLAEDGKLVTLDINEELEDRVRGYFEAAGISSKVDFRIGNALEIIPSLEEVFDLVFIDADKKNYWNYFELVIDKVRPGGMILADNVLWSGKIADEEKKDKDTLALRQFNRNVHQDPRVENVIVPLRDGISMIRKK